MIYAILKIPLNFIVFRTIKSKAGNSKWYNYCIEFSRISTTSEYFFFIQTHIVIGYVALTEYLWTKQIVSISSQKWSSTMKWFYLGWKMIAWTSQVSSYFVYVFVVHMNCKSLSSCLAQLLLYTKSSATTHNHPYSVSVQRGIFWTKMMQYIYWYRQ